MEEPGFVSDIYLPQMIYATTIRSPVAKGRLKSIECPKLPSGFALITAEDIPGKNRLESSGMPVFAGDELSYAGEPVALLLGPDKNTLEECARNCVVDASEEEPVLSIGEQHDGMVAARREVRIGNPEAAFASAESVVESNYSTGIQEHWYSEPTGAFAWLEQAEPAEDQGKGRARTGTLVVCTATQWPFHVRRSVAQVLGTSAAAVYVKPALTGLHMDGRFWYPSLVACHAALGAWITKRPVRLMLTREEDFSFSPKRCKTEIAVSSAIDGKGNVVGMKINAHVNLGAYEVNAQELLDNVCLGCLGVYKVPNIQFSGLAQRANIPPQGPFAGFGLAEGFFASERQASQVADRLGVDPSQWRKENFLNGGVLLQGLSSGEKNSGEQLLDSALIMSDYRRKWASYELLRIHRNQQGNLLVEGETLRGIGVALGCQSCGLLYAGQDRGSYGIEMILEKDGSLEIRTGVVSSGCSYGGIWAGIASEILGIDPEMVRISSGPDCPDSGPSVLSRNIAVITPMVEQACLAIRKQRFRDPLPIKIRKTVRPANSYAWDQWFPNPQGASQSAPRFALDTSGFSRLGWASAVVEVAIDPVEYIPKIRGVWMSVDGGKIISQDNARRSIKASVVQALGWAFREQIGYVNGVIPAEQFCNFDIPGPSEIPPISIDFIWNSSNDPKGIGDLPFSCVPAAYLQAVSQAMDYNFESIPLKSLDIWYALIRKRKEGGAA
ncbi:MAG: xanthine dehydrogenase family protein molybdopterin-binding subunit [Treponema sp.]|nr:xanthine dehydrogenase family protein molybdopterin-binding subunit [Treponema sp.]